MAGQIMADKWFAECLPCKWQEPHDSQTGAIDAASDHVLETHRDVKSEERARLKIGHVQLRTEPGPPAEPEPQAQLFAEPSEPPPNEEPGQSEPTAETTPEESEAKPAKHRGRRWEG